MVLRWVRGTVRRVLECHAGYAPAVSDFWWTIIITAGLTLLISAIGTVLILNLLAREAKVGDIGQPMPPPDDPAFARIMGHVFYSPLIGGNRITTLLNGDEIFPAMFDAVHEAQHTVTFENYVYWSGHIGMDFAKALAHAAQRGVAVHVVQDWLGSLNMDRQAIRLMRESDIKMQRYHQPHWMQLGRLNHRTHRKLMIVDGRVGFTGGVGIADEWRGDAQDATQIRDNHYRIEGPVVAQLQAVFFDNWIKSDPNAYLSEKYFPRLEEVGSAVAQACGGSPDGGVESPQLMYLMSIAAAQRSVRLGMAYFVPDNLSVKTLVAAAERGAKVQILVPGEHIDVWLVRRASRGRWGPLLRAGVEIYEYQPTMYHCKLLVVDEQWASIGSTNFDDRSFRLNDEANLNVLDEAFAREQAAMFDADLKRARRITLEAWQARPRSERMGEYVAAMLRAQL